MQAACATSKPHYPVLDGLRGVAAVIVVAFHVFETHITNHLDKIINHGTKNGSMNLLNKYTKE